VNEVKAAVEMIETKVYIVYFNSAIGWWFGLYRSEIHTDDIAVGKLLCHLDRPYCTPAAKIKNIFLHALLLFQHLLNRTDIISAYQRFEHEVLNVQSADLFCVGGKVVHFRVVVHEAAVSVREKVLAEGMCQRVD